MRKQIVRSQVKCGGSPEMISALSGRIVGIGIALVLVLIFAGCAGSDNGGAAVKSDGPQMAVSGTLPGSEYVGQTWNYIWPDSSENHPVRYHVLSVHDNEILGNGIGINGSALITGFIDLSVFEQTVATSLDWELVDENVEPMHR